ncbi:hypothetical protein CesoFtcFv8_025278 [Champsocephalus esox]|uniref:Uncharacterized protein n=1 Tax=Champsocephalus esox TaxID=159716 RepID=A0AAN8GER4_9TELE|nr:hypothetical protein CesoFtcFv8_025278 [Champsocephalus esox]
MNRYELDPLPSLKPQTLRTEAQTHGHEKQQTGRPDALCQCPYDEIQSTRKPVRARMALCMCARQTDGLNSDGPQLQDQMAGSRPAQDYCIFTKPEG